MSALLMLDLIVAGSVYDRRCAMVLRWLHVGLVVVGLVLALPSASRSAPRSAAAPTVEQRALALFEQSEVDYRSGKFAQAAALLRQAYAIHPEPLLLYNLARALESDGDLREARDAYQHYLASQQGDAERGAILRRIETLTRQLDDQARLAQERADADRARSAAEEQLRVAVLVDRAPRRVVAPWVLAGAGGAVLVVGGVLGGLVLSKHNAAAAASTQRDALALQSTAHDYSIGANAAFAVGGALVVAGIAWGIIAVRARSHKRVALQVSSP